MLTDNDLIKMLSSEPGEHEGGPSEMLSLLRCARRVRLEKEAAGQPDSTSPLTEHNHARNRGVLAHALFATYHMGDDPKEMFPARSDNPMLDSALTEAWALFEKYSSEFPFGFWGTTLAVEVELKGVLWEVPARGRLDLAVLVDEAAVARIQARFPTVRLNGPGLYIWDLKTKSKKTSDLDSAYEWGLQQFQYTHLAEGVFDEPIRGFIVFEAVCRPPKSREPEWAYCAAYPAETFTSENAVTRFRMARAKARLAEAGDECNLGFCEMFGGCSFKQSGACRGF